MRITFLPVYFDLLGFLGFGLLIYPKLFLNGSTGFILGNLIHICLFMGSQRGNGGLLTLRETDGNSIGALPFWFLVLSLNALWE